MTSTRADCASNSQPSNSIKNDRGHERELQASPDRVSAPDHQRSIDVAWKAVLPRCSALSLDDESRPFVQFIKGDDLRARQVSPEQFEASKATLIHSMLALKLR